MAHSLSSWQSWWAFSPHLCCIRTLFGVVGAQGRLDVCVCICAYLLYHVFMYDGCRRFPILPMVAFQQSSETAETRREACLNALLYSLGLSTSGLVWLQFILLGHLFLLLLPRSLSVLPFFPFFFSGWFRKDFFFYYLLVIIWYSNLSILIPRPVPHVPGCSSSSIPPIHDPSLFPLLPPPLL